MGAMIISMHEGNNVGLRWNNIAKTASPDDTMTIELIIIMFLIDTVIYFLVTWYVEAVFPGEYGVPQPWYFPLKRSYWFGKRYKSDELVRSVSDVSNGTSYHSVSSPKSEFFEKEPSSLKCGIRIENLSKTFDNKTFAVKNLSLNAYDGQITALLGHNGAGIEELKCFHNFVIDFSVNFR
jgi:ATP-binding cassette, subfamily A (ABC1), member 3